MDGGSHRRGHRLMQWKQLICGTSGAGACDQIRSMLQAAIL